MITFSALGKKGNLGNQLFQIASTIGIARKNDQPYFFPEWNHAQEFENPLPVGKADSNFEDLKIEAFEYQDFNVSKGNYDLNGWLQTEKYFDVAQTKKVLAFKKENEEKLLDLHADLYARKTILISVRRGDFIGHPNYFQLSYQYYFSALLEFFPDFETRNLIFISDDINYCKAHFGFLKQAFFLSGMTPFEQLILAKECDDFIISNSTFSWWAAWLGEKPNTKIIRPIQNFDGAYAKAYNDNDYFPDRWIKFDHRKKSIPIKYWKLISKGERFRYSIFLKINSNKSIWKIKKGIKKILKRTLIALKK